MTYFQPDGTISIHELYNLYSGTDSLDQPMLSVSIDEYYDLSIIQNAALDLHFIDTFPMLSNISECELRVEAPAGDMPLDQFIDLSSFSDTRPFPPVTQACHAAGTGTGTGGNAPVLSIPEMFFASSDELSLVKAEDTEPMAFIPEIGGETNLPNEHLEKSETASDTELLSSIKGSRRIFVCRSCKSQFVRKFDCERHERSIHTHELRYTCFGCDRGFVRSDARKRHWLKDDACKKLDRVRVQGTREETRRYRLKDN
ncbi:hypothetical protein DFH11DRAFT_1760 [Phellopilus nigrolimitatus]|nr:hypothetical protein DFH11DRAFT_1760 [Phellopilus nigrolimitatus]